MEIVRRHPEIQLDSDGNQLVKLRNQNLNSVCLPAASSEHHIVTTCITAGVSFSYACVSTGGFLILNAENGRIIKTIGLFRNKIESKIKIFGICPPGAHNPLERVAAYCILPVTTTESETKKENDKDNKLKSPTRMSTMFDGVASPNDYQFRCDVAILDIDTSSSNLSAKVSFVLTFEFTAGRTQAGELDQLPLFSLSVDGLLLGIFNGSDLSLYSLYKHVGVSQTLEILPSPTPMAHIIEDVEMEEFSDLETVVLREATSVVNLKSIFEQFSVLKEEPVEAQLPPVQNVAAPPAAAKRRGSKSAPAAPVSAAPKPVLKLLSPTVKHFSLFPLGPTEGAVYGSTSGRRPSEESSAESQRVTRTIFNQGIILVWEGLSQWLIFGLRGKPQADISLEKDGLSAQGPGNVAAKDKERDKLPSPSKLATNSSNRSVLEPGAAPSSLKRADSKTIRDKASVSAAAGSTSGKPGKNVISIECADEPLRVMAFAHVLSKWSLTADVTAVCVDEFRSIVALGQRDGVTSVWDLRCQSLCGGGIGFAKHETAITSMCCVGGSSGGAGKSMRLVSGALDGSLSFVQLESSPLSLSSAFGESLKDTHQLNEGKGVRRGTGLLRATLVDFRQDVPCPVVHLAPLAKSSLFTAVNAEGRIILFDCEDVSLLGVLMPKQLLPVSDYVHGIICP